MFRITDLQQSQLPNHAMTTYRLLFITAFIIFFIPSCTTQNDSTAPIKEYGTFHRVIPVPPPTEEHRALFTASVAGVKDSLLKNDTLMLRGYTTRNKVFFERVIVPALTPYIDSLRRMNPAEMINAVTLFSHEIFRVYFGKDFYRWGGDIFDLDDPQERSIRHEYRYGLDCSGFASMPYEIAAHFGLLDPSTGAAVFSSMGFERYCTEHSVRDRGGRNGTTNRFRLDTDDIHRLGREIFTVPKGGAPADEQIALIQAGDMIGRDGHFGIAVMIEGEAYYLESGGWVVPAAGGFPCRARESLTIFAKNGPVTVRRSLPDNRAD
jgi:hypothetical protein